MAHRGQTLENTASGERITFHQTSANPGGQLLAVDLELPANRRVPGGQHIHPSQEERFEVVEGTMRFKLGRKRVIAGPGDVVVVPAGQKHDFANVGDDDALVRVEVRPALKMEQLFETAVGLAEQGRTMLGGIRRPLELALFTEEFEDEVQGAFPPRWLQRIVLAPLAWFARRGVSLDGAAAAGRPSVKPDVVLGAAVIAMGLLAGLFFAFDVAVMPGLTAADDRTLVDAMQQMIDKIENPAFFLILLGAPALAAVALVQARRSGSTQIAGWIVAGLALYTVMVVVTVAFHFPLNEDLTNAGGPPRPL